MKTLPMVWIRTIESEDATGRLAEAYAWQARKLGRPTEFTQLGSLDAELVHARLILYRATENVPSQLSEQQRLLINYLTSILNVTPHCASVARGELCQTSNADRMIRALDNRDYAALSTADEALARYVEKLTLRPGDMVEDDIASLHAVGFDDLDILDANSQCAHMNYTNRVANGLGLLTEAASAERSRNRVPS
jgi:uncharacterized peroxidase-related enzyme